MADENDENDLTMVEDMITLKTLSEESIMNNLMKRYSAKLVYTYTGMILVAMNPFQKLKIYESDTVKKYIGKKLSEMPPHIYAIAESAYTNLKETKQNQSVIISGESGAGKSESTKFILQYITSVTSSESKESWVEQQILEANTVLESFGNAKTVRNDNSSRFGKFIQVNLNRSNTIVGACILNYLLEKSRVAKQSAMERNYHVFYELVLGASDEEKKQYGLLAVEDYYYLNQSGCIEIPQFSDKKKFENLKLAMTVLNMMPHDLDGIFKLLSAILLIGNVKFNDDTSKECVSVANIDLVHNIATLLCVNSDKLNEALCFRKLTIRGETTMVPLKPAQAVESRDSLAKSIYDCLFQKIVEYINTSLTTKEKIANFIGVLDIFGFEAFKVNSFEQLCINYTNEKLQQFFNQFIFKLEQDEYDKESIKWDKILFSDNQVCLDLIESKPSGILSLLDEETRFPKGTDLSWLDKLHQKHEKHAYYVKPRTERGLFGIKHYAGEVMYTVDGFLEKNKDSVVEELNILLKTSTIPWVSKLFEVQSGDPSTNKKTSKPTAATTFKSQLTSLTTLLAATAPHYVRCIKPNAEKESFLFDEDMVLSQLRYSGMLDTIRIRKAGFAARETFEDFVKNFKCLAPNGAKLNKANAQKNAISIIESSNIKNDLWQAGKTKIFFKEEGISLLKRNAEKILKVKAILIQKVLHGYVYRKRFKAIKKNITTVQRVGKGFVYRRRYEKKLKAIVVFQCFTRGWFARDYAKHLRNEALKKQYQLSQSELLKQEEYDERVRKEDFERSNKVDLSREALKPVLQPQVSPAGKNIAPPKEVNVTPKPKEKANSMQKGMDTESLMTFADSLLSATDLDEIQKPAQDIFSHLDEYDWAKKQVKSHNRLAKMAKNLTMEIDSMFDVEKEEKEDKEEDHKYSSTEDLDFMKTIESLIPAYDAPADKPLPVYKPFSMSQKKPSPNKKSTPELEKKLEALPQEDLTPVIERRKSNAARRHTMFQALHQEEEIFNPNAEEWSFESYANRYFDSSNKSTGFLKKGVNIADLLRYSKVPITNSLLKLPKSEKLQGLAIESFNCLLKVLDSNTKYADVNTNIRRIIQIGIDDPQLKDEIIIQICKQVTPPSKDLPKSFDFVIFNGWLLLTLVTLSFRPSKYLSKFFHAFVMRTIEKYKFAEKAATTRFAKTVEQNLRLSASKKYPPSTMEIEAVKNNQPMECQIHFLDGSNRSIEIFHSYTASDVLKIVIREFDVYDVSEWSIFEMKGKDTLMIKAGDLICDTFSKWESQKTVASNTLSTSSTTAGFSSLFGARKKEDFTEISSVPVKQENKIVLMRRVFKNPLDTKREYSPAEYNLLYGQCFFETIRDQFAVSTEVAIFLAALRAQAVFGDLERFVVEQKLNRELDQWLPQRIIDEAEFTETLIKQILDEFETMNGTPVYQIKVQYVEFIKKIPTYGSTFFNVKHRGFWAYVENIILSISEKGISFIHPKSKQVLKKYLYSALKGYWNIEEDTASVLVLCITEKGDDDDDVDEVKEEIFQFITEQSEEIALLIREYCPHTTNKRKSKELEPEANPELFKREILRSRIALLQSGLMKSSVPEQPITTAQLPEKSMKKQKSSLLKKITGPRNITKKESETKLAGEASASLKSSSLLNKSESMDGITQSLEAMAKNNEYVEVNWLFTRERLQTSLAQIKGPPDFSEWAVGCNEILFNYSGILTTIPPRSTEDPTNCPAFASSIARLLGNVIDTPYLSNELYLQLIRCTSEHPDSDGEQVLKFWKLLSICIGCILPSNPLVLNYLKSHLRLYSIPDLRLARPRRQEANFANFCVKSLGRSLVQSARKSPPGYEEIISSSSCLNLKIRIYFLDGQFRAFSVYPQSTIKDIFDLLAGKIKLKLPGFAIYESFGTLERSLDPIEKIADILYKWDKFNKSDGSQTVKFYFKRKLFLGDGNIKPSPFEELLLRSQAIQDLKDDVYPLSGDQLIYACALIARINIGETNDESFDFKEFMCQILPPRLSTLSGFDTLIKKRYTQFTTKTVEECYILFMKLITSWIYYGYKIFNVEQYYSSDLPNQCWLAVGQEGVFLLARYTRDAILELKYADIDSFVPSPTGVLIIATDGTKYVFSSSQGAVITHIMMDYIGLI